MLVSGKTAVVFGGSGAIGCAVAHALAREGAHVHVGARHSEKLEVVVEQIRMTGGNADLFAVDVLDGTETIAQMDHLASNTGGLDLVINATGFLHDQGKELRDLSLEEFKQGIDPFLTAQFNISKAATPHMGHERTGVVIAITAPAAPMSMPGHLGHIVGCAGMETFCRALASELGPRNIRVICLRSHAIADAIAAGSHTHELFAPKAQSMGLSVEEWLAGAAQSTMLHRLPTLSQVAETVVFLASDHAGAVTGSVFNMTAGSTLTS